MRLTIDCGDPSGLVRAEGLEPPRLATREPKSRASTNSATPAEGTSAPYNHIRAAGRRGLYHAETPVHTRKRAGDLAPEEPPIDRGQRLREVFRNQPRPGFVAGFAMQPDRRAGGLKCRHLLRQQPGTEAGEHIA